MQDLYEHLEHITLSAGGYSISYHLTSHQSKDYFQAAIIQSGPLEKSGYMPPPERQRLETKPLLKIETPKRHLLELSWPI